MKQLLTEYNHCTYAKAFFDKDKEKITINLSPVLNIDNIWYVLCRSFSKYGFVSTHGNIKSYNDAEQFLHGFMSNVSFESVTVNEPMEYLDDIYADWWVTYRDKRIWSIQRADGKTELHRYSFKDGSCISSLYSISHRGDNLVYTVDNSVYPFNKLVHYNIGNTELFEVWGYSGRYTDEEE